MKCIIKRTREKVDLLPLNVQGDPILDDASYTPWTMYYIDQNKQTIYSSDEVEPILSFDKHI